MKIVKTPEQEIALTYLYKNKKGKTCDLLEVVNLLTVRDFIHVGWIDVHGENWKVTDSAIEIYKSFYKSPNIIESLKGLYCHYILKI
jgi:hypothetical protein